MTTHDNIRPMFYSNQHTTYKDLRITKDLYYKITKDMIREDTAQALTSDTYFQMQSSPNCMETYDKIQTDEPFKFIC